MTLAKLPLPSLRFVIRSRGRELFRLIPATTPKGRVVPGVWCLPGNVLETSDMLKARCKRRGWSFRVEGDDSRRRRG